MSPLRPVRPPFRLGTILRGISFLRAVLPAALAVAADDNWQQREDNAAWRAECSACHLAFPPGLLSPDDWAVIMSELDKHFGANASLEERVRKDISAYLVRNGNRNRSFGNTEETPRITGTEWFFRSHKSAIRLWQKGRVKSLVDCAVCHKGPDIERMSGK
ncbi:MAG: hypothetical protein PHU46_03280 [Rhodocyclaceae bacterium]|nr:hypothetical protein [Rhodocyclaceae bacterium]